MKPSVIIIDENVNVTEVMSEFLRLKSINVLATGHNGKEAVELYMRHSPDVVLMDLDMSDFDGLCGLKNICKINPNAKIIVLTDNVDYNMCKKVTALGVSSIILKPQDMNDLVKTIDKLALGDVIQLDNYT